jgi:UDP-N-acetylglucosamine diphosphorylase / glucose-1-phosphate thymidylyltransferase / UDP-N-acetylgalactosamine diphosphorylase / glucosamine-1-phosphate N-acetyltransferase / galactosamine-1-phosphate N-acetyltransferase
MHAVILAAGKGSRMAQTHEGPKQLLPLKGKPIIEHTLDSLPGEINEVVIVVGGPHEMRIREYFKGRENDTHRIHFVHQEEQLGTAHAFGCVRAIVHGRWLGLTGDDIFAKEDLSQLLKHEQSILAARVSDPSKFGVLVEDDEHNLSYTVEKPQKYISDLVWTGAMVADETFFQAKTSPSGRGEYETPDVWTDIMRTHGTCIRIIETRYWLPVNDKTQLLYAEQNFKN